jgi:hypothetical protein
MNWGKMSKDEDPKPKPKPKNPNPAPKKVFDVMRPGKAPASPNSRNVIVGHKKPVKDDMFVPAGVEGHAARATNPYDKHEMMNSEKRRSINPSSKDDTPSAPPIKKPLGVPNPKPKPESETAPSLATPLPAAAEKKPEHDPLAPQIDKEFSSPANISLENKSTTQVETQPAPVTTAPPLEKDPLLDVEVEKPADKPSPEQVAMSQVVDNPTIEISEPEPSEPAPTPTQETPAEEPAEQPLHHDIVAQTGAPLLDHAVVSHHKHHTKWWVWVLVFLFIVGLAVVALNFLLDAEVITTEVDVPYTNLIK